MKFEDLRPGDEFITTYTKDEQRAGSLGMPVHKKTVVEFRAEGITNHTETANSIRMDNGGWAWFASDTEVIRLRR
jgi:hypothetical protein